MCFGNLLMLRQSDMSRMRNLMRPLIDSGKFDNSIQDLSLSTSKFTSFPVPSGSAANL